MLLSVIEGKMYSLLRDLLAPDRPDSKTFTQLAETLMEHFQPKTLVIAERFYFHSRNQKTTETIGQYVAELRRLATHCEFRDTLSDAVRDRLVCRIANRAMQCRLLTEINLTLSHAMEIAQGMEATEENVHKLKVTADQDKQSVHRFAPADHPKACYRCGGTDHVASACRFKEAICRKCQKRGHIARVCRSSGEQKKHSSNDYKWKHHGQGKYRKETHNIQEEHMALFSVKKSHSRDPITVELKVNGKVLPMEVDTGAAVSLIPTTTKQQLFPDIPLTTSTTVLTTYTGERIKVAGKMKVEVRYGGKVHMLQLYVVEGEGPSLLGRDWLLEIKLDWGSIKVASVNAGAREVEALLTKYQEVFEEGLGQMNTFQATLHLMPDATPRFLKARSVPIALKEGIEVELDHLEKAGVVERVTRSQWAAPIVPVPKRDGKLHLCGDYKVTCNPMLEMDKYPLPKPDDLFATIAGGKSFTKIDLTNAYQQMILDEDSRDLVTINTHKGLYRYIRLPFGVASAPAIFQKTMDMVLQGLPSVICYLDDLLITGRREKEHLANLKQVLQRLKQYGIRAKHSKCSFLSPSVEYLGHCVDATGLHMTHSKVEAIQKAPRPGNIQELRSFLGFVHY